MRRGFSLLVLRSKIRAPWRGEDLASFFCIKKVCTYLISWTYADKLHTLKCIIYFHNVRQHAHKKTSSKTGFTLVCHSFTNYYIFLFKKCQTKIFLLTLAFSSALHSSALTEMPEELHHQLYFQV